MKLWKSDGTADGTVLVADIYSGTMYSSYLDQFTVAGNLLFFTADDGVYGRELWQSDGTASGTGPTHLIRGGKAESAD